MGATEIDNLRVSSEKIEIDLTDAGAQEGSLTFHSAKALAAGGSEGCTIVGVEDLGEDLWKVSLAGRTWGDDQSVTLRVGSD